MNLRALVFAFLAWQLVASTVFSNYAFAAPAAPRHSLSATPNANLSALANLNLSSTQAVLSASSLSLTNTSSIRVGGVMQTVNASSLLTPAELFAFYQVSTTGVQTLRLSAQGNAVGGTLNLSSALAQSLTALVIPQGVKFIDNFGKTQSLNLSGDLVVDGKFVALSTNPQITNAAISADSIYVGTGGVLTSFAPNNSGMSLGLSLNAARQLLNQGTIAGSGNVNIDAPSLTNQARSQITAQNSLSLNTTTLVNEGSLNALSGDLKIQNTNLQTPLNISGNGNFQAASGQILVSSLSAMNLSGGNYTAKDITLTALNQSVNANVNAFNGPLTVNSGTVAVTSNGPLNILALNVTGDPFLASSSSVSTPGGSFGTNPFTVLSGGAISLSGDLTAGDITLVSGVTFQDNGDGTTTIIGTSGTAGADITTSGFALNASGNVDIGAFGNVTTGPISLNGASGTTLKIYGTGDVTMGSVSASTQSVDIRSANPLLNGLTYTNNAVTGGQQISQGTFAAGSPQSGNITQAASTAFTSGSLNLSSLSGTVGPFTVTTTELTANTTGNVTVTNIGSLSLEGSSTAHIFTLSTEADASGNGQIIIDTGAKINANVINMASTSVDPGIGGINQVDDLSTPTLIAGIITLSDTGTSTTAHAEDISAGLASAVVGTPILFTAQTALGNATFEAVGSVTMQGASFAGTSVGVNSVQMTFALSTVPDSQGNGAILMGSNATITSGAFLPGSSLGAHEGQLKLFSASTGNGNGGISQVDATSTNTLFGDITLTNDSTSSVSGAQDITISAQSFFQTLNAFGVNGNVNLTNAGRVDLGNSSAGQNFTIISTGGGESQLSDLETMNGSIYIEVNPTTVTKNSQSEPLAIDRASTITANNGNVTLLNDNTTNGTILIESQVTINVGSPDSGGTIIFSVGPIPANPEQSATPQHVTVKTSNGGKVFFNNANITGFGTGNVITANTNQIIFSTTINGQGPAEFEPVIQIGRGNPEGGVNIQSTLHPILFSLDLTNALNVAFIKAGQASGFFGGKLTVGVGGQATGGTLILTPSMMGIQLTAENIPQGVTVSLNGFGGINNINPINVYLSRSSTSSLVEIDGSEIINPGAFGPIVTFASTQPGTWLNVSSTGSITSKDLFIDVVGNETSSGGTVISGVVSSPSLSLSTSGNLTLNTSIGSPTGFTSLSVLVGGDIGTIIQNAGTIMGASVSLSSGYATIGTTTSNLLTTAKSLQLQSLGNGNFYITNNGAASLLASSTSFAPNTVLVREFGTTIGPDNEGIIDVQNIGALKITGEVNATTLTLASSGKGAGISVGALLGSTTPLDQFQVTSASVELDVQSPGSITQAKGGSITSANVILNTVNGSIGGSSASAMLAVNTVELSAMAGTSGNVYINNSNPNALTLDQSQAGGTFSLFSSSSINVNGAVSGQLATALTASGAGITINAAVGNANGSTTLSVLSGGAGTITAGGAFTVTGASVTLNNLAGGNIGTSPTNELEVSAPTLTVQSLASGSGSVYVDDLVATTVSTTSFSGGSFLLTSGGLMTIKAAINSPSITLRTDTGSNGGITIAANVGSANTTTTTLSTDGSGKVLQTGGLIDGTTLSLNSGSGTIGLTSQVLKTQATNLIVNSSASAFVSNTGTITIDNTDSKGGLQVTSSTGLIAGNVASDNGFITLTATKGQLRVIAGDTVQAGNNITLNAVATTGGSIDIGVGANVNANSSSAIGGNVVIAIGKLPAVQTNTIHPANVVPNITNNGNIFYGKNGINALGSNNAVSADAATVTFSTSTAPKTAITLEGNVNISAQAASYKEEPSTSDVVDTGDYPELAEKEALLP